jgi:TRAP-type mannitol/chloroaromatic compound transport system permease large subunit
MELFFLFILIMLMVTALGSGFPVAFALPGSAIISVGLAALAGYIFAGSPDAYFAQAGPSEWLNAGVTNFRGVYWEVERDTLIAIPLFVFMGIMLQRSRIAEDLLVTMAQLFGPVRGGLGMSVVFVGALLAATTGIVGATVVAMGLISLPAMLRNNYSHPLATGTIAASGTLGQIIPPSIVLIILADQLASATDQASAARKALHKAATGELSMPSAFDVTSTSAGEMFLGAFVPGLVLVGFYIVFIAVLAFFRPSSAPAVPYDGKYDARFAGRVALALIPPLALIFIVLGSIIMGIATVNQAGAIGAAGALIMSGYRLYEGRARAYWPAGLAFVSVTVILTITQIHPINVKNIATSADVGWLVTALIAVAFLLAALIWSGRRAYKTDETLTGVMVETAKTTSLVFIILLGAAMLTAAFRAFGGEELVKDFLTGLPGGFWGQFIIVMAVIFVLGFFLDFIEIAVVVVPIVAPILLADPSANITAVWLGVMIGLNIQTSFLTPPFGFALFYLRGVAPAAVKTLSMYKGVIAFICLQLLALVVVAYNPKLVNYLPLRISLTAETAPPPVNPRLQLCMEEIVFARYDARGSEIGAAIGRARQLDMSSLPEKMRKELGKSFDLADKTFALVADIGTAEAAVDARTAAYRPLHRQVRQVQTDMARIDARITEMRTDLSRLGGDDANIQRRKQALADRVANLEAEKKALEAAIPAAWTGEQKQYSQLLRAEQKARTLYRRNADTAYEPVQETIANIAGAGALAALRDELDGLGEIIESRPPAEAADQIAAVRTLAGDVAGTSDLRSELGKVRRALTGRSPDPAKASQALAATLQLYDEELAWRQKAEQALLPGLSAYEQTIRNTIGLRQQPELPKDEALEIASCMAAHRDISLNF